MSSAASSAQVADRRVRAITQHLFASSPLAASLRSVPTGSTPSRVLTDFPFLLPHSTRFGDVDAYMHVNNVEFYSYFDTVINTFLMQQAGMQTSDPIVGVCAASSCNYSASVGFPANLILGLRVTKLSRSSVTYEVAVFHSRDYYPSTLLCALGSFVHVFVTRKDMKPIAIPPRIRKALEGLQNAVAGSVTASASTSSATPSSAVQRPVSQCASAVLMVSPLHFRRNDETAADNTFMQQSNLSNAEIQQAAQGEFDAYVSLLRANGIKVEVHLPPSDVPTPDSLYPNNWFSTHAATADRPSTLVIYPMRHVSRRLERNPLVISALRARYDRFVDLSGEELSDHGSILEGTGAAVFDHVHRVLYHSISERSYAALAEKVAQTLWPAEPPQPPGTVHSFEACDAQGRAYYHTNVIMAIGTTWAVLCVGAIRNATQAEVIVKQLESTGHTVVRITRKQVEEFCGNVLELQNQQGQKFVVMSDAAFEAFTAEQKAILTAGGAKLLHTPLPTIEKIGGGGARCMIAELF